MVGVRLGLFDWGDNYRRNKWLIILKYVEV